MVTRRVSTLTERTLLSVGVCCVHTNIYLFRSKQTWLKNIFNKTRQYNIGILDTNIFFKSKIQKQISKLLNLIATAVLLVLVIFPSLHLFI